MDGGCYLKLPDGTLVRSDADGNPLEPIPTHTQPAQPASPTDGVEMTETTKPTATGDNATVGTNDADIPRS